MRALAVWGVAVVLYGCAPVSTGKHLEGVDPKDAPDAADAETDTSAPDVSRPEVVIHPSCDRPADDEDMDGDGFTHAGGDCDECQRQVNPGAFDFPGNAVDEDCANGDAAEEESCDSGFAIASSDARDGARAVGLCRFTEEGSSAWGVISARYTKAAGDGSLDGPEQTGILPNFGSNEVRAGATMLALSSGAARAPGQAGYTSECDLFGAPPFFLPEPSTYPPGLPRTSPDCPGVSAGSVYNAAALEVRLRVPTNAQSFSFESNFFTFEYPDYICDEYNDFYVALVDPPPSGAVAGNVVFDRDGSLVSVNNSLLQVCEPGTHAGRTFTCPLGTDGLEGTGFDATAECGVDPLGADWGDPDEPKMRAATGWLMTTVPVEPGSIITVRFAVWDSGDPDLDSLVLIDHLEWSVEQGEVRTEPIPF